MPRHVRPRGLPVTIGASFAQQQLQHPQQRPQAKHGVNHSPEHLVGRISGFGRVEKTDHAVERHGQQQQCQQDLHRKPF